jgi:2',3'-cyclic-nucleotide 2'-phosphodiesterase
VSPKAGSDEPSIAQQSPVPDCLRLALIGDVVGKPGMRIACAAVPWLQHHLGIDCLIVNGENAADGSGIRCKDYRRLIEAGYHAVTLGDHAFRKREIMEVLANQPNIVRACNLPDAAPGKGQIVIDVRGVKIAILNALGRVFMKPIDCPFRAVERELQQLDEQIRVRVLDFHAEATSDKQVMGRFLDGRVSAVLGTHTHVATADEQILPGGTGFQCDVGMTGPFDGILGRRIDPVLTATLSSIPLSFQVASGDVRLSGTWVDIDTRSGHCRAIGRIEIDEATVDAYQRQQAEQRKIL